MREKSDLWRGLLRDVVLVMTGTFMLIYSTLRPPQDSVILGLLLAAGLAVLGIPFTIHGIREWRNGNGGR